MKFRNRLKTRIIIAFLAFSTVLGVLFTLTSLYIQRNLENNLIGQTIKQDLDRYMESWARDPLNVSEQPVSSRVISALITRPEKLVLQLPLEYAELPDGIHRIQKDGKNLIIAVNKQHSIDGKPYWGYVVYDGTPDERQNSLLYVWLSGAFGLFLLIAFAVALWLSRRILTPLRQLANRISRLGQAIHPEPLAPHFADDEVGKLASALDDYAQRLTDMVISDKEFNADVSHELRTPLAIIASTTELLLAQDNLDQRTRERLHRIERAVRQSGELIETLLLLARKEQKNHRDLEKSQAGKVVRALVEDFEPQLRLKPVTIEIEERDWLQVDAPEAVLSVALGNLIGNAIKYTPRGTIRVLVDTDRIVVSDQGPGVKSDEIPDLFNRHYRGKHVNNEGSGLGLAIVKRLCDLYGWDIRIAQNEEGGLRAELVFHPQRHRRPGEATARPSVTVAENARHKPASSPSASGNASSDRKANEGKATSHTETAGTPADTEPAAPITPLASD